MLVEIMKPNFEFKNDEGALIQLVREGWKQVNVLYSKKDSKRGGHYHKISKESFYIITGKIKLLLENTIMVSMYDKGVELENGEKDIYE